MAVQVDICGSGFGCLAADCGRPARLWIKSERSPRMRYCPGHLINRIHMYQRRNREVMVAAAAQKLLAGEVPA